MPSDAVEVKVNAPCATIVLNRPDSANALTRSMIADLREHLRDLYLEKKVRAIILTGAGDIFCGGRDVKEMLPNEAREVTDTPAEDLQRWAEEANEYQALVAEMLEMPKPIIASVNGPAAASGAGLVLACDVVIASNRATFGLPDARRGVVAGIVAPLLAFRLGAGIAARLAVTAQMISADEAHRTGVYHELVDDNLLWARAAEIGQQCAEASPEAISLTKRLLFETVGEQLTTQLTSGAIASATARFTESAQEGLKAFSEKRAPNWIEPKE